MLISVFATGAGCRAMLDLDDNEYTLGEAGGGGSASTASGTGGAQTSATAQGSGGGSECAGSTEACADGVPEGWQRVGYAGDRSTACGPGFTTADVLADLNSVGDACVCEGCTVTAKPSCKGGAVDTFYDAETGAGQCDLPSESLSNAAPGQCAAIDTPGNFEAHFRGVPPPPTGGSCELLAVPKKDAVVSTDARVCVPEDPSCEAELCAADGAFTECILADGLKLCPDGPFTKTHIISTGVDVTCGDCGCSVSAECSGSVTFYSDAACTKDAVTLPVDNTCVETTPGALVGSYKYVGILVGQTTCAPIKPPEAMLTAHNLQTLCCK